MFLEFVMKKTVYIEQFFRFEELRSAKYSQVCHPLRTLYGLKEASQKYYLTFILYLIGLRYKRLKYDHYVFNHKNSILNFFSR